MYSSIQLLVQQATSHLESTGVHQPRRNAIVLLENLVGKPLFLIDNISQEQIETYNEQIALRAKRIPLQHILGYCHFRNLKLSCEKGAFIPRPETELLVDIALHYCTDKLAERKDLRDTQLQAQSLIVADFCAGSGNIAISIATELSGEDLCVYAFEKSDDAMKVLSKNNSAYADLVQVQQADVTSSDFAMEYKACFDCVVTNPPYIPTDRQFFDEVAHDPKMALYGGSKDGLNIPAQIAENAFVTLKQGGMLVMEHDDTHQDDLCEIFADLGYINLKKHNDLAGKPRFISAVKP